MVKNGAVCTHTQLVRVKGRKSWASPRCRSSVPTGPPRSASACGSRCSRAELRAGSAPFRPHAGLSSAGAGSLVAGGIFQASYRPGLGTGPGHAKEKEITMRRKAMVVLALSAALALGVAAIAGAAATKIRAGNLVLTFGGTSIPKKLPRHRYAPVTTAIFGKIATSDGTHPSALRESVVDIDKDVRVDPRGLSVCKPGQLEARNTAAARRVCGKSTIGHGIAHAEIAFPEQAPIKATSPITIFNGGGNARRSKMLIHTFLTVPIPAAIVTQVTNLSLIHISEPTRRT